MTDELDDSIEPAETSTARSRTTQVVEALRIELEVAGAELFHTPSGEAYIALRFQQHVESVRVDSEKLRSWLQHRYFELTRDHLNEAHQRAVIDRLTAIARFDSAEQQVHVRIARIAQTIYLDLADDAGHVAIVTPSGWQLANDCQIRFRRTRSMRSLPVPRAPGAVDSLRSFFNVDEDGFILIVAFLLGCLRGQKPFPLLILNGEQGTAKSSTTRLCQSLIDPKEPALRAAPRNEQDLFISAIHNAVLAFDNLSSMPDWLSNALCKLSTGGGLASRQLYTNDEEIVLDAQRPVILNGIESLAVRGDLAERAIVVRLEPISETDRETESELRERFEEVYAQVLGGLLTATSTALARESSIRIRKRPRMADFVNWVLAAEPALPWPDGRFAEVFEANRHAADSALLEGSPVARDIYELSKTKWRGTATQLLERLNPDLKRRSYPTSARTLSDVLTRLGPALRNIGIGFTRSRASTKNRERIIEIFPLSDDRRGTVKDVSGSSEDSYVDEDDDQEFF